MTVTFKPIAARALLATGLLLGVAAAHAASGYTVTKTQESLVTVGMTADEVKLALGHPEREIQYRNEPGPTFTYRLTGELDTLFDVDFNADGRVASVSERLDETGASHGHGAAR